MERTLQGGGDAEILSWAREHGVNPTDEQTAIWSAYAAKRGWRDDGSSLLKNRVLEAALDPKTILTFFDHIDQEEGRPLHQPLG